MEILERPLPVGHWREETVFFKGAMFLIKPEIYDIEVRMVDGFFGHEKTFTTNQPGYENRLESENCKFKV